MNQSRRNFLCALGTTAISTSLVILTQSGTALAAESLKLDPEHPTAKSLNYVHESQDADRNCLGCQFYTGVKDSDWGPCVIFPDKQVSAKGLCNSWYARA